MSFLDEFISSIRRLYSYRSASIFTVLVITILVFYLITPEHRILSSPIISVILRTVPELGIIAISVTLLMICQEFDLSVGSVLALSSMVMVWSYKALGLHPILAVFLALVVGSLIGALNGVVTVKFGIPSFITTLGTMMWWRGVLLVVSGGHPKAFHPEVLYPAFESVLTGKIGGVFPVQFIWFLAITLIISILLERHKFGNQIYATGANKEAARAMGIDTDRIKIICFMIVGLLTAFAGCIQATRIYGSNALQGTGLELEAIAATVIGGTELFGGVGTIIGTLFGVILVHVLRAGLLLVGFPAYWYKAGVGLLIVVAVVVNTTVTKRRGF